MNTLELKSWGAYSRVGFGIIELLFKGGLYSRGATIRENMVKSAKINTNIAKFLSK